MGSIPMIESLIYLLIWICVLGLIYWLEVIINAVPLPDPVKTVVRIVVMVILCLIVIYMLIGFLPPLHGFYPRRVP